MFHDKEREIRDTRTAGNRRHVLSSMLRAAPTLQMPNVVSQQASPGDSPPTPPDTNPPVLPSARLFDRVGGSVPQIRPVTRGRKSATNTRQSMSHSVSARDGISATEQTPNAALAMQFHGGQPSPRFVFQGATSLSLFTLVGTSHASGRAPAFAHSMDRLDETERSGPHVSKMYAEVLLGQVANRNTKAPSTTASPVISDAPLGGYPSKSKHFTTVPSVAIPSYAVQESSPDNPFALHREAYGGISRPPVRQKDPTQSLDLFPRVVAPASGDIVTSCAGPSNLSSGGALHMVTPNSNSGGGPPEIPAVAPGAVSAPRRRSSSSNKSVKAQKKSSDFSGSSTESDDDPFPCSPPAAMGPTKHTSTLRTRGASTTSSARRRAAQPNVADADEFDDPFPTKKAPKKKIPIIVEEEWEGVWAMPTSGALESAPSAPVLSLFTAQQTSLTENSALPSPHHPGRAPSASTVPIPTPPARRSSDVGKSFSERRLRSSSLRDEQFPVDHVVVEDMCDPSPSLPGSRMPPQPAAAGSVPSGVATGSFRRKM